MHHLWQRRQNVCLQRSCRLDQSLSRTSTRSSTRVGWDLQRTVSNSCFSLHGKFLHKIISVICGDKLVSLNAQGQMVAVSAAIRTPFIVTWGGGETALYAGGTGATCLCSSCMIAPMSVDMRFSNLHKTLPTKLIPSKQICHHHLMRKLKPPHQKCWNTEVETQINTTVNNNNNSKVNICYLNGHEHRGSVYPWTTSSIWEFGGLEHCLSVLQQCSVCVLEASLLPSIFCAQPRLWTIKPQLASTVPYSLNYCRPSIKSQCQKGFKSPLASDGREQDLSSCFCSKSIRESSWLRCGWVILWRGVLRSGGETMLLLGTSWYWPPPRLSPQKLKIFETPEKAPTGEREKGRVWNHVNARAW